MAIGLSSRHRSGGRGKSSGLSTIAKLSGLMYANFRFPDRRSLLSACRGRNFRIIFPVFWGQSRVASASMRRSVTSSHARMSFLAWTARDIHQAVLTTLEIADSTYGLNQLRYDLRKLKGHGLLERDRARYQSRLEVAYHRANKAIRRSSNCSPQLDTRLPDRSSTVNACTRKLTC